MGNKRFWYGFALWQKMLSLTVGKETSMDALTKALRGMNDENFKALCKACEEELHRRHDAKNLAAMPPALGNLLLQFANKSIDDSMDDSMDEPIEVADEDDPYLLMVRNKKSEPKANIKAPWGGKFEPTTKELEMEPKSNFHKGRLQYGVVQGKKVVEISASQADKMALQLAGDKASNTLKRYGLGNLRHRAKAKGIAEEVIGGVRFICKHIDE